MNQKLICLIGLPGAGKSSVAQELGRLMRVANFCEPEEKEWPDCVLQRHLSGAFAAAMWFRSVRTSFLYQAEHLKKQGFSAIIDSYFDKLFYFCLGRPGMEWLVKSDDPYFEVIKKISALDLNHLPSADYIVFLDMDYLIWQKFLATRKRNFEKNFLFNEQFFLMQNYLREGVEYIQKKWGSQVIVFRPQFNSPRQTAHELLETLKAHGLREDF